MKCRLAFFLFVVISYAEVYMKPWNGNEHETAESVRQEFNDVANSKLVTQMNKEQMASYFYWAYAQYFSRSDVALPGFAKLFSDAAWEKRDHAEAIMSYVNKRGGVITLDEVKLTDVCTIVKDGLIKFEDYSREEPCICNFMARINRRCLMQVSREIWFNGLIALQDALVLERYVNKELLLIHEATKSDPHLSYTLEHVYLDEQVSSIKTFSDHIRHLYRVGPGLGEYEFDKTLLK